MSKINCKQLNTSFKKLLARRQRLDLLKKQANYGKTKLLIQTINQQKEIIAEITDNQIIRISGKEARSLEFNMRKIRQYWHDFYSKAGLPELARALPKKVRLSQEQIELVKEKAKQGFDKMILMPPVEIQLQQMRKIMNQTSKPMKSLPQKIDYSGIVEWQSFDLSSLSARREMGQAYIMLIRDQAEVPQETKNKSAHQLRRLLESKRETSFTLTEYLLFQREYVKKRKKHPDRQGISSLLDLNLASGKILTVNWQADTKKILLIPADPFGNHPDRGCRASVLLKLR